MLEEKNSFIYLFDSASFFAIVQIDADEHNGGADKEAQCRMKVEKVDRGDGGEDERDGKRKQLDNVVGKLHDGAHGETGQRVVDDHTHRGERVAVEEAFAEYRFVVVGEDGDEIERHAVEVEPKVLNVQRLGRAARIRLHEPFGDDAGQSREQRDERHDHDAFERHVQRLIAFHLRHCQTNGQQQH